MTPTTLLWILVGIASAIVTLALLTVLWRAVTTRNDGRRAVLADMMFITMVALFLCISFFQRTSITYEVAMFAGLFAALTTAASARIITRGRR